jgi:class 3 adenylate cyclase/tetratricopeptide (TPR) repeat protein
VPKSHEAKQSEIVELIQRIEKAQFPEILQLWSARDAALWAKYPELWRASAERLIAIGEPLLAYDIAAQGKLALPDDLRITQLLALSLARMGNTQTAYAVAATLTSAGHEDEETLGIFARTSKDLGLQSAGADRNRLLQEARDLYQKAYSRTGGYWTAINAATLSLLIDDTQGAHRLSDDVREQCVRLLRQNPAQSERFWLEASLAEALLLKGHINEAIDAYSRAKHCAPDRYADIASARKNAKLIVDHLNVDWLLFAPVFALPRVAVCTGHMIDAAGRRIPRFPQSMAGEVKSKITRKIQELNVGFGYASAACGSDILFLEALLEAGKEISVVLPYAAEQFRRDSVAFVPQSTWGARFDRVLKSASQVTIASNERLHGGPVSFSYGNRYLRGLASLRAERLGTDLIGLAVWNGRIIGAPGGTSDIIAQWQSTGLPYHVITLKGETSVDEEPSPAPDDKAVPEFRPQICGLLFADAVGFSKLQEEQIPVFVRHFLGGIAGVLKLSRNKPIFKNTWGDGLYFAFDRAETAGHAALELREWMQHADLQQFGLPETMTLRIGLHVGPVYVTEDPIVERTNYVGTHVSRAARIEPITPPGEVYASEAFAALAVADGVRDFRCEYVGQTPQAKGYGTLPTYLVKPRTRIQK